MKIDNSPLIDTTKPRHSGLLATNEQAPKGFESALDALEAAADSSEDSSQASIDDASNFHYNASEADSPTAEPAVVMQVMSTTEHVHVDIVKQTEIEQPRLSVIESLNENPADQVNDYCISLFLP